ncbi:Arm DNA-binding domain-containing protein [Dyella telluris]|uniref:Arm DNA-binding domain-containing protein n=1 Tax=Dyella telluris TaxID=2763498 RepID=UPI001C9B14C5|nr:Arm DNA-binding domain-containing protein [Dyella telluris]
MLTDTAIRKAKPSTKPFKLADGGGLYLLVKPDGARYWRMKYRIAGKEKLLALGVYPHITLLLQARYDLDRVMRSNSRGVRGVE